MYYNSKIISNQSYFLFIETINIQSMPQALKTKDHSIGESEI